MQPLSYKTFIWPHNPHTYREKRVREGLYEKNDAGENVFLAMGEMKRIITGEGVFFGESAYVSFLSLANLFEQKTPGEFFHPIWGTRSCYFTGLELTQEPKENYVSYRFEFQQADGNGNLPE